MRDERIAEWIDKMGDRLSDRELGWPDGTIDAVAEEAVRTGIDPQNHAAIESLLGTIWMGTTPEPVPAPEYDPKIGYWDEEEDA